MNSTNKGIKITLSLALMVFVLTITPASSLFNIVKPASAAQLTSMSVSPMSNVINEMAAYDFLFKTATTGTIKTIEISFPSSFDVTNIRLLEREGIGSGTLSFSGSTIKYTVGGSDSIPAGTKIRLEIARIIATAEGSFTVSIKTLNIQGGTIDGPTTSGPFIIKSITSSDIADNSITGSDVSTSFMKTMTLQDDETGHAHGWDPNGAQLSFNIVGISDIISGVSTTVVAQDNIAGRVCEVSFVHPEGFGFSCTQALLDASALTFTVINAPVIPVTPASSSISSSPFDSLQNSQNVFPPSLP